MNSRFPSSVDTGTWQEEDPTSLTGVEISQGADTRLVDDKRDTHWMTWVETPLPPLLSKSSSSLGPSPLSVYVLKDMTSHLSHHYFLPAPRSLQVAFFST